MRTPGISLGRLMDESEHRLADIAREGAPAQSQIARRLLDDTRLYQHWEAEHARLMRGVAAASRGQPQAAALRRVCFGLVHRKAMFEYLRQEKITGRNRHAVFALVFGAHDYANAVLKEHANYVRSLSSLLCSRHLGLRLMEDRAVGEPLWRYEQLYADYFRSFCGTALSPEQYKDGDTLSTLLPLLKGQVNELRRAILGIPREPDFSLMDTDLDAPAANTQRMLQPKFNAA
ncbi:MAG: hypothetical protein ABI885_21920 [Gammaproteobacteria bacterium]